MPGDGRSERPRRWPLALAAAGCALAVAACASTGYDADGVATQSAPVAAALAAVRSGRCPAEPPAKPASDLGSNGQLLASIVPTSMLLCGYVPVYAPVRGMRRGQAVVTDPALLRRLRTEIDQLKPPPSGPRSCPADLGRELLQIYTDGTHVVELVEHLGGCGGISDGVHDRDLGTSDFSSALTALLPASLWNLAGS